LLDKGEVCDSVREGCAPDCSACMAGYAPSPRLDALGMCTTCGNGVTDPDEVCDTALDPLTCSSDCDSCFHPYVSIKRRCVTCGNGLLDRAPIGSGGDDEVCDSANPGCAADCSHCEDGYIPAGDALGTCTADCAICCASLQTNDNQVTNAGSRLVGGWLCLLGFLLLLITSRK